MEKSLSSIASQRRRLRLRKAAIAGAHSLAAFALTHFTAPSAKAAIYYWDTNGTTAGLGNTAGTWGTSTFEGTVPSGILDGTAATAGTATASGDSIYFGTNNLALGSTASSIAIAASGVTINTIVFGTAQGSQAVTLSGGGGTITLAGTTPTITVNNSSDTIGAVLAGTAGLVQAGGGTLLLTGAESYTGTTTVTGGGTLTIGTGGSLSGATPLTFSAGGGVFNVTEAAGSTQAMGALTASAGDGTVQSTFLSTSATVTFASLAARSAGATLNFVTSGGANGSTNTINFTTATAGFISQGDFFGGNNYAYVNSANGYVRGINYGTDANSATSTGTTTLTGVSYQQITGAITAQNTATFVTIDDLGSNNLTLASGQTLTLNGFLESGGTSTLSGGTAIQAASGAELVIRTDLATDNLTISTNIAANGSNALTKSGLGTLTLAGVNAYTGTTTIDAGTLALSGGSAIVDTGAVVLANAAGATLLLNNSETIGKLSGGGFSGGNVNVQGNTLTLANAGGLTFGGTLNGTSAGDVAISSGTLTLSNKNTFAGTITLSGSSQLNFTYGQDATAYTATASSGGTISMAAGTSLGWNPSAQVALGVAGANETGVVNGNLVGEVVSNPIVASSAGTITIKQVNSSGTVRYVFSGGVTGVSGGATTLSLLQGAGGGNAERTTFTISGAIQNGSGGTLGVSADFQSASGTGQGAFICLTGLNTFTGPIIVNNTKGLVYDGGISDYHGAWFVIGGELTSTFSDRTLTPGSGYLGGGNYTNTISLATGTILDYASSANQILGGSVSGTGSIVKEASGTLTLSGANGYSGATTIVAGMLTTGATGTFAIGGVSNGLTTTSGSTSATLTTTTGLVNGTTYAASGADVAAGTTFVYSGSTAVTLSQNATATGSAVATQMGVANALGISSNAAASLLLSGGTLQYANSGAAETTDRLFTLGASSTLDASGANSITFSNTGSITLSGTNTSPALTMTGTGSGVFSPILGNNGTGTTSVVKSGTGTWTLNAANTYTGTTTINGGTLALGANSSTGAKLAATAVTVNNGGTFAVLPGSAAAAGGNTLAGSLTLNAGSAFTMAGDGATSTFTVTGASTLAPASGVSSTLTFDLNGSSLTAVDSLVLTGGATVGAAKDGIYINYTGTGAPTTGTYNLISVGSGTGLTAANFFLGTDKIVVSGTAYSVNLSNTGGTVEGVTIGTTTGLNQAYWLGGVSGSWSTPASGTTNWTTDAAGQNNAGAIPTSVTDVYFSATGASNLTTSTVDTAFTINSLNLGYGPSATGATSIGGTGTLTINSGGISVASGVTAAQAITAPITLGAPQTWTNNSTSSAAPLTVGAVNSNGFVLTTSTTANGGITLGGVLSGTGGLTVSGAGTTVLSAANSYSGATGVSSGTLQIASAGSLGAGSYAGSITLSTGALFEYSSSAAQTLSGVISGSGSLTKDTGSSSTLALSGANSYTGTTTITNGTLQLGAGSTTGTLSTSGGISIGSGAVFSVNETGTVTQGTAFSTAITGAGGFTQAGTGTTVLNAANSYTGPTTISAGTLSVSTLANAGSNSNIGAYGGTNNGGLIFSGGTLYYTGGTASTNRGFQMTANGGYLNVVTNSATLTLGNFEPTDTTGSNPYLHVSGGTGSALVITTLTIDSIGSPVIAASIPVRVANVVFTTSTTFSPNFSPTGGVTMGSVTNTASGGNGSVAIGSGTIDTSVSIGSGTFSMPGAATLVFSGNTFVSGSISHSGVFMVSGSGSLGATNSGSYAGTISDSGTFNYASSANQILSGIISSTGSLTMSGSGTLTLTNANTYGGKTTVSNGTLQLGNGGSTGALSTSSAITITAPGVFAVDESRTMTQGTNFSTAAITGTGGFTQAGSGTTVLNAANTYTGPTTLLAGTLNVGSAETAGTSGPLGKPANAGSIVFGGGTLQYSSANQFDYSGRFSTASGQQYKVDTNGQAVTWASSLSSPGGSLTVSNSTGSGSLTLAGSNTFTGNTKVVSGTLVLGNALALQDSAIDTSGAGAINFTGVTTPTIGGLVGSTNLASLTLPGYNAVTNLNLHPTSSVTYSGIISDGATGMTLTMSGAGTQILTGASTYTGGTNITAGTLTVGSATATTGSLGTGAVTIGNTTGAIGTLNVNTDTAIASTAAVTINTGSSLYFNDASPSIGSLNGSGNLYLNYSDAGIAATTNLTINSGGNFSGSITDSGNFGVFTGSVTVAGGTLTLSGANSFGNGTTVNSGATLIANGISPTGSGTVTVNFGATLGGSGTISGPVSLSGTIAPGVGSPVNTAVALTSGGGLTFNSGAAYNWRLIDTTPSSVSSIDGTQTGGTQGTDWDVIELAGNTLALSSTSATYTINVSQVGSAAGVDVSGNSYIIAEGGPITGFVASEFVVNDSTGTNANDTWTVSEVALSGGNDELVLTASTPEPGSLGLLGVASLGLLRRRRAAKRAGTV